MVRVLAGVTTMRVGPYLGGLPEGALSMGQDATNAPKDFKSQLRASSGGETMAWQATVRKLWRWCRRGHRGKATYPFKGSPAFKGMGMQAIGLPFVHVGR